MVTPAPKSKEIADSDLGIHQYRKIKLFPSSKPINEQCCLVSAASQHGLVFAGSSEPELKVILAYKDGQPHRVRSVPLPSPTLHLSVNCDCSLLAVEVINNGVAFIQIYSVPSFLSAQVQLLQTIRVSPEANVKCRQLCWNPTMANILAVCLHNGALSMYTIKDQGFEFHSLDKQNNVQSVCWSPKGKQIVAGQLGFKLVQYKPDLSVARTIQCPVDPAWGTCSIITIQWLSTYQFAVAMLPSAPESVPNVLIVNAPKSNQIALINYRDDLCFGDPGPRPPQMYFLHIQEWNMLLVASANSPDVDMLATTETGDAPTWIQHCLDLAVVTPTIQNGDQTFPVGLSADIGGVQVADRNLDGNLSPLRLSIHLMANYGHLISFSVRNNLPNMKDVCSPPPPPRDQSGLSQFVAPLDDEDGVKSPGKSTSESNSKPTASTQQESPPTLGTATPAANQSEMTFNFGAASTPIVQQKATSIFGNQPPPATGSGGLFGATTFGAQAPATVKPASTMVFPKMPEFPGVGVFQAPAATTATVTLPPAATKPATTSSTTTFNPPQPQSSIPATVTPSKPLISVPPKFSSPSAGNKPTDAASKPLESTEDDDEALAEIMREDIAATDAEIKDLIARCRSLKIQIGTKEEMAATMRDLSALTDFSQQAVETSEQLVAEVRMLNLSLNEAFLTTKAASDSFARYKNPEQTRLRDYMAQNPANRRRLMRLENALANNEQQMNFIQKQLVAQWAEHEEVKRQYSKDRMHIPCLEGVYETLTRQKEILFRERQKINYLTNALGVRLLATGADSNTSQVGGVEANLEDVAGSMLSMTLSDTISSAQKKVDEKKMRQLTAYLEKRPVTVICPARPKSGVSSEVILARKEKLIKAKNLQKNAQAKEQAVVTTSGKNATDNSKLTVKTKVPVVTEIPKAVGISAPVATAQPAVKEVPNPAPKVVTQPVVQKAPTIPAVSKPISFGGFGESLSKPPQTNVAVKENVAPNVINTAPAPVKQADPPATSAFNFGGLNLSKKDEPAKAAAAPPAFSFNIPQTTKATTAPTAISATDSSKGIFGGFGSASTQASKSPFGAPAVTSAPVVNPFPVPATTAAATTAQKPIFGGLSSGPLTFGSSPGTPAATSEQKSTPISPFTITKTTTTATPAPAPTPAPVPVDQNAILDNLKICSPEVTAKPTPTTMATSTAEPAKNLFSSNAFGNLLGTASTASPTPATITPAAPATSIFGAKVETPKTVAPVAVTTNSPATTIAATAATTSIFAGFGLGSTTPATTAAAPTTGSSLFGAGAFGGGSTTGTTSIFGSAATASPATSEAPKSLFGGVSTTSVATSPVATSTVTTTPLPKPDQSVFGQPATTTATDLSFSFRGLGQAAPAAVPSPFGQAVGTATPPATQATSIFGAQPAAPATTATAFGGTGGSLFGGQGSTFGSPSATTGGSIFGGGSPATAAPPAATGGSIFGGQPATTSVFGGGQSTGSPFGATAAPNGGSIFGGASNATPATGGSIFGGGAAASTGSAFGSAATTGGSIFGGGQAATASPASSGFSFGAAAAAPAFGSPAPQTASPFGAPAGGTTAPAFGQPASPFGGGGASPAGAGLFGKPAAFGSPPAFGAPATFGGPPVFGGTASFGGGGAFGSPPTAAPTQQNNLFASLGASDTSLSFGQIAQSNAIQQPKPAFGGSAFSSWR